MKPLVKVGKDLRNQVQLGTVAAAKMDTIELGVLGKGFRIKQAQSKGKTSVVETLSLEEIGKLLRDSRYKSS